MVLNCCKCLLNPSTGNFTADDNNYLPYKLDKINENMWWLCQQYIYLTCEHCSQNQSWFNATTVTLPSKFCFDLMYKKTANLLNYMQFLKSLSN